MNRVSVINRQTSKGKCMRTLLLLLTLCLGTSYCHAQFGQVQFIHNTHDAGLVDVYVDDVRLLDDLDFRTATSFVSVPPGTHKMDLVAGTAENNDTVLWSGALSVVTDAAYVVAWHGPASALEVVTADNIRLEAQTDDTEFFIIHGAPNLGPADLRLIDPVNKIDIIGLLANNIDFGAVSSYQSLPSSGQIIEITNATNTTWYESYFMDLRGLGGQSFVLLLSGPGTNSGDGFYLMAVSTEGNVMLGSIEEVGLAREDAAEQPKAFVLQGNYPNPFSTETRIDLTLAQASPVHLTIYDALGRDVAELVRENLPAGRHEVLFEAEDLPSGVYFYRLKAGSYQTSGRMVLIR